MPSEAILVWEGERARALDSLVSVHKSVTGGKRGRQNITEHFNQTMFVALAAAFQGFCRDLHDDMCLALVEQLPGESYGHLYPAFLGAMTSGREIDRKNAQPSSVSGTFQAFGLNIWPSLERHYPKKGPKWKAELAHLNDIRNGVVHANERNLVKAARVRPLDLRHWKSKRSALTGLARGMDTVAGKYIADLTGAHPWERG